MFILSKTPESYTSKVMGSARYNSQPNFIFDSYRLQTELSSSCCRNKYSIFTSTWTRGFPHSSAGKESTCNAGDPSLISGSGRSAGEGIGYQLQCSWVSLVAQSVKNLPAMWETWVQSLGEGKGCPLQYSWPGEFHGLQSMGSQRVKCNFHLTCTLKHYFSMRMRKKKSNMIKLKALLNQELPLKSRQG